MFRAKTEKIDQLAITYSQRIKDLEKVLSGKTNIYIDYANVLHWQGKLGFHIDFKRLKQLFDSFENIKEVKLYQGFIENDKKSTKLLDELKEFGYTVRTKPVKKMILSIDVSGIELYSPTILHNWINKSLLRKLDIETVEFLNGKLAGLNARGITKVERLKCNFDVEIGSDMLIDNLKDQSIQNFVLMSGDSDFADTITQLQSGKKNTVIFSTARRISTELANSNSFIFDIQKIKWFICWKREMKS